MAEQPIGLSVEVPENQEEEEENRSELDMEQENEPKLSLNLGNDPPEEDETQRSKYGVNSPKGKKKGKDLDDEEEEEDDAGAMTPATKLRQEAGINSPKQQKTMTWGNAEGNNSNGVAGVITQVSPTDAKPSTGGIESFVTQVSRDDANAMAPMNTTANDDTDENKDTIQMPQSGGVCACLSTLLTCCSNPAATESHTAQSFKNQTKMIEKKPELHPVKSDPDSIEKETPNDPNGDEKELSQSRESSTDYGAALLPALSPNNKGKRCLVLDLDETLVHSSFKPVNDADFVIPVEIDGVVHKVYVLKRPYVDEFLLECSKSYELVIFTASLSKYADPLLDQLDTHRVIAHRLFRESCTLHGAAYVKDMRRIGRRLRDIIFVDNSPHSYSFQPKNAVPIASWFDDRTDTQLRDFLPVLNTTLLKVKDVRNVLDAHNKPFSWLCRQANVDISKFES